MPPTRRAALALCALLGLVVAVSGCGGSESGETAQATDAAAGGGSGGPWFHAATRPVSIVDKQGQGIAFRIGETEVIECDLVIYEAGLDGRTERLPMRLHYHDCELNEEPTEVDAAGCRYVLEAGAAGKPTPLRISCPTDEEIRISLPGGCTLEAGPQTPDGGVLLENTGQGAGRSFDAAADVTGVAYTTSGPSGCPAAGDGHDISIVFGIELYGTASRSAGDGGRVGLWVG